MISVYLLLDLLSIQLHRLVRNVLVLLVRIEARARLRCILPVARDALYRILAAQMLQQHLQRLPLSLRARIFRFTRHPVQSTNVANPDRVLVVTLAVSTHIEGRTHSLDLTLQRHYKMITTLAEPSRLVPAFDVLTIERPARFRRAAVDNNLVNHIRVPHRRNLLLFRHNSNVFRSKFK